MVCELLGAVQCLAICFINLAWGHVGATEVVATLWVAGVAGLGLAAKNGWENTDEPLE